MMTRRYLDLERILLDDLPSQCKTCGLRFRKNDTMMGLHLDAHFRRNRRLKERGRKVNSRNWFLSLDQWINQQGAAENETAQGVFC